MYGKNHKSSPLVYNLKFKYLKIAFKIPDASNKIACNYITQFSN